MSRLRLALLALAIAAVVACGGGGSSSGGSSSQPAGSNKLVLVDFKFQPKTISGVSAGKVVFFLVNDSSSTAHDMVIADSSGTTVARSTLVQPGNTETFTVPDLKAGSYVFYCDLPGHRAQGMEGTLTVS